MDEATHGHQHEAEDSDQAPQEHWEDRYRDAAVWSGNPNATLVDVAAELTPGRALDLGCGEGADAIWLAQQGWAVTGIDISPTAVERARAAATEQGLDASSVRFDAADLSDWVPHEPVDLVAATFLHSNVELPRTDILRRVAQHVIPGGHVLVISHAEPPPWADLSHHAAHDFPTPEQELAELELDQDAWRAVIVETRTRAATSPDGEPVQLTDGVLLVQRLR